MAAAHKPDLNTLRDQLERVKLERQLQNLSRADFPVSWQRFQTGRPVGVGSQSQDARIQLDNMKGWVDIALRVLSDRISGIPWFGAELDVDPMGEEIVTPLPFSHPLNVLLRKPNPVLTGDLARMLNTVWIVQTGTAYWQKLRDGLGVVRELWPIPPQLVEPLSSDGQLIGSYRVTTADGKQITLQADEVLQVWRPDPRTVWSGRGRLEGQATDYDADLFMSEHVRAFFQSDATPRVAMVGQAGAAVPRDDDLGDFNHRWAEQYNRRRGSSLGLPAFIPPGFQPFQFNAETATGDHATWDDRWSEQFLAAYGVSKFSVGIDTNVNRATAETSMWAQDQNTIEPITNLIAAQYTSQVAQEFAENYAVRFRKFVQADKAFELEKERSDLQLKVRSVNEVRDSRGDTPVPWGEVPVGSLADAPYTGEDPFRPELTPRSRAGENDGDRLSRSGRRGDFFDPDRVWERNQDVERNYLTRWARAQQSVFEAQLNDTLINYARAVGVELDDLRSEADTAKDRRKLARASARVDALDVFIPEAYAELFWTVVEPIRQELFYGSAEETHDAVRAGLADVVPFEQRPYMVEELARQGGQYITQINSTTLGRVQEILADGAAESSSPSQIASALDGLFRNRNRSTMIALTEVGMANQSGVLAGYQSSGVVNAKRWNTSRDAAVRDSHQIDGQTVAMNQSFTLADGVTAAHPLDPTLPAGDVIRCRCFMTPVLVDDDQLPAS